MCSAIWDVSTNLFESDYGMISNQFIRFHSIKLKHAATQPNKQYICGRQLSGNRAGYYTLFKFVIQFILLRSSRSAKVGYHPRKIIIIRKIHTGSKLLLNDVFCLRIFLTKGASYQLSPLCYLLMLKLYGFP